MPFLSFYYFLGFSAVASDLTYLLHLTNMDSIFTAQLHVSIDVVYAPCNSAQSITD